MLSAFRLPTRTTIAPGALSKLATEIRELGVERPFLVFDQGLSETRWPPIVRDALSETCDEIQEFSDVDPNPRVRKVDRAGELARQFDADGVVGIGGGSVLDTAKMVSMLARNPGSCKDYEGKNLFANKPIPFIAIPTTCGTGSEVTWVAVVSDSESRRKISIKGDGMYPSLALVDADLIQTLPRSLISYTGLDALTHAIEAFVSRRSNPISDALATWAITLIMNHLEPCVNDPNDASHRSEMMKASTLAGIAFGNADVGAVHCLSESIGGLFDHPHGLLNAQLLVPVMRYQHDMVRKKLDGISEWASSDKMLDQIEQLISRLNVPPLQSLAIPVESFGEIASLAERNNSNASDPRNMAASDYRCILDGLH